MTENNIDENTEQKKLSKEDFYKIWKENATKIIFTPKKEKKVFDLYGRDELNVHLERFTQHCMARGIKPTFGVILDWLYSDKVYNERDDFVKISRLMEMISKNEIYPILILDVLKYAQDVEKAALEVYDELGHLSDDFESLKHLREALENRLYVRQEEQKQKTVDEPKNSNNIFEVLKGIKEKKQ